MILQKRLGVALDIGTTTIQGSLMDLKDKKRLSCFSCLSGQLPYGHDIISRIKFCLERPDGLAKLHRRTISSVNFIIENLTASAKENRENISLIAAVGNAASYYLTLSLSPKKLVEPPYEPEYKDLANRNAKTLGVEVDKDCEFIFLPNVGGFVGSDAIAVILAVELDRSESPLLAVDMGTNGEIILGARDKIWAASTAAGPAFEGWHISCGMRAVEGAVESVEDKEGRLAIKVIGGGQPKGISGSGLIDIIAILLKKGYISSSGSIKEDFVIYDNHKRIYVSQDDVRQVQLAKAAFSAGIRFLRRLSDRDVTRLFVTGNFGNYLNKENAAIAGIIPQDIESDRIEFLESGALRGAEIFINNKESVMPRIEDLLKKTEHIHLGGDKDFQREFVEAMKF